MKLRDNAITSTLNRRFETLEGCSFLEDGFLPDCKINGWTQRPWRVYWIEVVRLGGFQHNFFLADVFEDCANDSQ